MSEPWRDINDPGFFCKPTTAPADNTRVAATDELAKPKEKPAAIATLSDARFVLPQADLQFNDKCPVQVSVQYKEQTPQTRVTFKLFCNYNGDKQDLSCKVDANERNGVAKAELQLFYPDAYSDGPVEFFFTAQHCRGDKNAESDRLTLPTESDTTIVVPWIFDCHMHINSGHCAPLPLSKSKVPLPFANQKRLDLLGSMVLGEFGDLQKQPTDAIGARAVSASADILSAPDLECLGGPAKRHRVIVNMPMNMDYAHYRGYEGRMIYENVDGRVKWWNEKESRYEDVSQKDFVMWEKYTAQLIRARTAFCAGNGALVSFYNYDPRANLENWRVPFDKSLVQTAPPSRFPQHLPTIGIKMYTALGYRPMDPKLNFPWHEYYDLCASNQIPITCHGSRGGMTTHDMLLYYDREHPENTGVADTYKQAWFTDNFVGPYAWEPVLQKHPSLTLCLAHFGGDTFWDKTVNPFCDSFWQDLHDLDEKNWIAGYLHLMTTYPNFYVDLAYFLFEPSMTEHFKKALAFNPIVKERILFGTDWWMYTMVGKYKSGGYLKYVQNICDRILAIDDDELFKSIGVKDARELLAYFMTINPMRFLQLKKHAGKLADAFNRDDSVISRGGKFELADWINEVPEAIADFPK